MFGSEASKWKKMMWVRMGIAAEVLGVITTRVGWVDLSEVSRERHESEAFMRLRFRARTWSFLDPGEGIELNHASVIEQAGLL